MSEKQHLRDRLRTLRRDHAAALPDAVCALVFSRPPAPVAELVPEGAIVGLYHSVGAEAPSLSYARWFHENGHAIALPWFADRAAPMGFRRWTNPYDEDELETGPFGMPQPPATNEELVPECLFVPLLGFTAAGDRLGQGGGHYDTWLAAHPGTTAIGLAWDCQRIERLPTEAHDHPLRMVVTPTQIFEGTD